MNILLSFFIASMVFSQDFVFDKEKGRAIPSYIGQMKLLKGKAFKKNDAGTQEVSNGERFKKSDILITDAKSFARIQMVDDTIISIGPQSELQFDDIDFIDKTDRKLSFTLLKGQLSGDIKNKAKPDDLKFRTRYTSMGVRGTYFLMNHQEVNALAIAEYALLSGNVNIEDDSKKSYAIGKGEKLVLIHDASRKISGDEKEVLSKDEFSRLEGKNIPPTKFKPLLPYFNLKNIHAESPLYRIINTSASPEASFIEETKKRQEETPSLDEKLKLLNKKLKDNRRN